MAAILVAGISAFSLWDTIRHPVTHAAGRIGQILGSILSGAALTMLLISYIFS